MTLQFGASAADITPPSGLWMSGYAFRNECATGVHDPLMASVLVATNGARCVAIISLDLISLPQDTVDRMRSEVSKSLGTTPEAIMVHCTHTHGAPYTGIFRAMGERSPEYDDFLCMQVCTISSNAAASVKPATMFYSQGPAQIGINRRCYDGNGVTLGQNPIGPMNPLVQTFDIKELAGSRIAVGYSHACHPTTMGGDNLEYTGDWMGAAARAIQNRISTSPMQPVPVLSLQGCCGDVNPVRRGDWDAVEANGRIVADAALLALDYAGCSDDETLDFEETCVDLPLLRELNYSEALSLAGKWRAILAEDREAGAPAGKLFYDQCHLDWALDHLALAQTGNDDAVATFSIQKITIGEVTFLGFPAELFISYQLDLQSRYKAPLFVLSYTNGCLNYLPAAADYPFGGYEVRDACRYYARPMFTAECEHIVRSTAYGLLGIDASTILPLPSANHGQIPPA